jgi:transposase
MGGKKLYQVLLRLRDRKQLQALVHKGVQKARAINRARILLMADQKVKEGCKTDQEISKALGVSLRMVAATREKYSRFGLRQALGEKPRSGHPPKLSGKGEALLTTIACSDAPEGRSRWTLRLLADKLVELKEVDSIAHETVRRVLKKTTSSRGRRSSGALGK